MTEPMREGLPPMMGANPRVMVLGSFPSEQSLATGQYYANPQNQFWPLVGTVFGFAVDVPYEQRCSAITANGVALWDVIRSCRRKGSLDARIERKSLEINDFGRLLAEHPGIEQVFVNGATAFDLFARHVATTLPVVRLPSSSTAATMPFAHKLARWRELE